MSRKSEALELLALNGLTDKQRTRLNLLTAQQHMKTGGSITLFSGKAIPVINGLPEADGFVPVYSAGGSYPPDYVASVDRCLTLAIGANRFWMLQYGDSHPSPEPRARASYYAVLHRTGGDNPRESVPQWGYTLPLAMLKVWWQIQPEQSS